MCLAIPAKVIQIEGDFATVDIEGIKRQACIVLLEDLTIGDYVIVHAGFAINKLDLEEAEKTLEVFRKFAREDP